jgi:hypothetical protein
MTRARADSELRGLVYSLTPRSRDEAMPIWERPALLGGFVLLATLALNLVFF